MSRPSAPSARIETGAHGGSCFDSSANCGCVAGSGPLLVVPPPPVLDGAWGNEGWTAPPDDDVPPEETGPDPVDEGAEPPPPLIGGNAGTADPRPKLAATSSPAKNAVCCVV